MSYSRSSSSASVLSLKSNLRSWQTTSKSITERRTSLTIIAASSILILMKLIAHIGGARQRHGIITSYSNTINRLNSLGSSSNFGSPSNARVYSQSGRQTHSFITVPSPRPRYKRNHLYYHQRYHHNPHVRSLSFLAGLDLKHGKSKPSERFILSAVCSCFLPSLASLIHYQLPSPFPFQGKLHHQKSEWVMKADAKAVKVTFYKFVQQFEVRKIDLSFRRRRLPHCQTKGQILSKHAS